MNGESFALVLVAGAKWISYIGMTGFTGAVAIRWMLRNPSGGGDFLVSGIDRRLLLFAGCSAAILLVGAAARLYAQTWSVFGLDEAVTLELVRVVGIDSRWGGRWQSQAAFAVLAVLAVAVYGRQPRVGWWLMGFVAAGAWITLPMTGHAMSLDTRVPWLAQVAHGIGAGAWVGSLAALVAIATGLVERPAGHRRIAELVGRFSPMAVVAVGVIAVSGVVTAVFYVGAFAELRTTGYGRVLLLKVVLFLATGALGAYNWRLLTPRLGDEPGTRALLRSARLELVLAAGVLLVTAVLVHLAMPAEMG